MECRTKLRADGFKIKNFQTDNGSEYVSKKFSDYLNRCGIQRRLTVQNTPQQNVVSERMNRTLLDMGRCMLLEAKLYLNVFGQKLLIRQLTSEIDPRTAH